MTTTKQNDTHPYFGFNLDAKHGENVFVDTRPGSVRLKTTEPPIAGLNPRAHGWMLTPAEARDLGVALISAAYNTEEVR